MMKILAIGNSFSQDATSYLYDIAKADCIPVKVVNLYIGGCSLETHVHNIESDEEAYDYELNGQYTGRKISIKNALIEEDWNYVTLQQVSSESGVLESYYPYIIHVSEYVKLYAPGAKQLLHQTWAYEHDSTHSGFAKYHYDQLQMYEALTFAYEAVAKDLSLRIIPCGKVIQELRKIPDFDYVNSGISLCRDGFHMNILYGRYATAATWYEVLLKQNILNNNFLPPNHEGEAAEEKLIKKIKAIVHQIVLNETVI